MKYVGLTDVPDERKSAHGYPPDWTQFAFKTEDEARKWEKEMLAKPGHKLGSRGREWRYGYTYTIISSTVE